MAKENAGQAGGSGSNVENPAKREWGGVGEAVRPAGSRGWPPARTPPNSLTRVSAAAGRSAGRRAAFSLQGGPEHGAEVALPSFPGAAGSGGRSPFRR